MKIRLLIRDSADRRSLEQIRRHDELVEKAWRGRVARNPKERDRLYKQAIAEGPGMLKRQAE